MFSKFLTLLNQSNKKTSCSRKKAIHKTTINKKTDSKETPAKKPILSQEENRPRVAPERIGEIGEIKIAVQLRQFPKECQYLNDVLLANSRSASGYSQIDHVLITPVGVFVIETKNYAGRIKGRRTDEYWRVNGKPNLKNPLRQNHGHIEVLRSLLKEFHDLKFISMISFTKRCELYIDNELRDIQSDELVVADIRLTDMIERKMFRLRAVAERPLLTEADVSRIVEIISSYNITDAKIRAEHVRRINETKAKQSPQR